MDILSRVKEIVAFSGLSVRAFAIKCGIAQKTLDNQLKGLRGISLETIAGVINGFPNVSAEWLLRGEGKMLLEPADNSAELARLNKLIDTIATLQETINAKSETIAAQAERIKQLETQITKK